MGSGQWKFIHERIKSCDFYTNMTMINKWVMGNGNSYMKESKVEVLTQMCP